MPDFDPALVDWIRDAPTSEGACAMEPLCPAGQHIQELRAALLEFVDAIPEINEASAGIFGMALAHGVTYDGPTLEAPCRRALGVLIATAHGRLETEDLQARLAQLERRAVDVGPDPGVVSGPWSDTIEGAREGFQRANSSAVVTLHQAEAPRA